MNAEAPFKVSDTKNNKYDSIEKYFVTVTESWFILIFRDSLRRDTLKHSDAMLASMRTRAAVSSRIIGVRSAHDNYPGAIDYLFTEIASQDDTCMYTLNNVKSPCQ